jgi:hypothetical protein
MYGQGECEKNVASGLQRYYYTRILLPTSHHAHSISVRFRNLKLNYNIQTCTFA